MEIYFVNVVEDLLVTAFITGLVFAYARDARGRLGMRIIVGFIVVAVVASLAMALMKQNTALIATGDWNMGIFIVSLVVALVALICFVIASVAGKGKKDADGDGGRGGVAGAMHLAIICAFGMFMALRIFYKLPDVINYPANFGISAGDYISTDFAYRIIGYLLGIALIVLIALATAKACKALNKRMMGLACGLIIAIVCITQTVSLGQLVLARRLIAPGTDLYKSLFSVTSWISNNAALFTFAIMAIMAALAVFVIVISLRDNEPYANPAEHRKIKARWRNRRRWAICLLVCLLISGLTITVIKDYANRGPELSPSEECEVRDGNVYVSLDQVQDGHLHRFTYTTEAGVPLANAKTSQGGVGVRFIVIKKPGSSAYGIGLDACEICGETGYYERDGQVVCKLCDVVMNINTIGFKGGCNPIPVEYKIEEGYIVFDADVLTQYEKTFK